MIEEDSAKVRIRTLYSEGAQDSGMRRVEEKKEGTGHSHRPRGAAKVAGITPRPPHCSATGRGRGRSFARSLGHASPLLARPQGRRRGAQTAYPPVRLPARRSRRRRCRMQLEVAFRSFASSRSLSDELPSFSLFHDTMGARSGPPPV